MSGFEYRDSWQEEGTFDRDMATAERWDRLDDLEARGWDRVDGLTRDVGERPGRSLTPKTERRAA